MCSSTRLVGSFFRPIALVFAAMPLVAQSPSFQSIPAIPFDLSAPVIRAHTETEKPFTVAGERGVILGQQNGVFEAWALPVKLLSHMTIEADIEGYTVPIDVNQQAAAIEVRPDRTIITYSHIGFTVRQIMFSPDNVAAGTGPVVLYEFDCLHPTEFIFRFTPELRWMWPERNEGVPGLEWVAGPHAAPTAKEPGPAGSISGIPLPNHGYYVLHSDYPDLAAAVTIPGAEPGVLAPYQERPQVHPAELHVHIDPSRDKGRLFPLLMAVGINKEAATNLALGKTLEQLNNSLADLYRAKDESYKKLLANSVSIETPDKALNEAFQWAVVSIEQLKTKALSSQSLVSGHDFSRAEKGPTNTGALAPEGSGAAAPGPSHLETGDDETALVAGYYASADSARPGFGWFFGRDALYTLYAVNGYGNFALSKSELEFLIKRQRDDGKIMHEYSQTAPFVEWRQFPYMYAAADSTPLFLLAVADYVRASGDVAFLTAHREAIEKAWAFETDPAHDTDHDGIYDNSQGTGWVESWPGGMPHQEIYLALLDQQASAAMGQIYRLLGDEQKRVAARGRSYQIARKIETEYQNDSKKGCYAFSRNLDGSVDRTTTVYPALAWWSDASLLGDGTVHNVGPPAPAPGSNLLDGASCLRQFVSHTLNTDWGLRDVANDEKIYDGMSYHQGSVWPLFTGWAALAEYRGGQPLAGYQILMENANLTKAQDLGAVTELLSGDFFVPFGRSTSHQLWSSAMVITPILRGLFGITIDAQTKTITVNPQLPAAWDHAAVRNLQLSGGVASLNFRRVGDSLEVQLVSSGDPNWHIRSGNADARVGSAKNSPISPSMRIAAGSGVRIPVPLLEIDQTLSILTVAEGEAKSEPLMASLPNRPPIPGARTSRFRFVRAEYGDRSLKLVAEGIAGTEAVVSLVRHARIDPRLQAGSSDVSMNAPDEGQDAAIPLKIHFPPGEGWKTITVTLTW